jgi:hypothetical protein
MRVFLIVLATSMIGLAGTAQAQRYTRSDTWDTGFLLINTGQESVTGDFGTGLDIRGETGWGAWGAYNFSDNFALGFEWTHIEPKYSARYLIEDSSEIATLNHRATVDNLLVTGIYHFLDGDVTPFIEGGIGWTWLDSNVATGPPTTGCWWDWWWGGYVCNDFYNTYNDRVTTYSYAVGLRWDISTDLMLRVDYGVQDIDASARSGSLDLETLTVAFGWRLL